jgi:hypothetical protein
VLPPFPFILERGKRNMGWIEMVLKSDLIEMKETLAIQIPWPIILQKKKIPWPIYLQFTWYRSSCQFIRMEFRED